MATINEKLQSIQNSKDAIKNAINAKGGTAGNVLSEYAAAIAALPTGGGSPSDPFVTKEFKSFVEAEELEYINVRGALLWTKDDKEEGQDGYLLASNGDPTEVGYWDPNSTTVTTPTKTGYTLIGVCLGNGYWVRIGYAGLTTGKYWCQSGDGAYAFLEGACYHSGWEITQYMRSENHPSYTDCIWNLINDSTNEPLWEHLYIPNGAELVQCCNLACDGGAHTSGHTFSKNLGTLCSFGQNVYWSGSQYPNSGYSFITFAVPFYDGGASGDGKDAGEYRSVALFHFGA